MAVHNHPPYRPVCRERVVGGQFRGACLNDDGDPVTMADGVADLPMTVERALLEVHRDFCADDAHDDVCSTLRAALVIPSLRIADEATILTPDAEPES